MVVEQQEKPEFHNAPNPQFAILGMIGSVRIAKGMHVAVQLGLPDLIGATAMSAKALAEQTGTHEQALYRLLRALASIGQRVSLVMSKISSERWESGETARMYELAHLFSIKCGT